MSGSNLRRNISCILGTDDQWGNTGAVQIHNEYISSQGHRLSRTQASSKLACITVRIKRLLSTQARSMVQSSQRVAFVRNSRVYNRSTTKIPDIAIVPVTTPMTAPVLFWFPSGGGDSWVFMSTILRLVDASSESVRKSKGAASQKEWRHNLCSHWSGAPHSPLWERSHHMRVLFAKGGTAFNQTVLCLTEREKELYHSTESAWKGYISLASVGLGKRRPHPTDTISFIGGFYHEGWETLLA